MARCAATKIQDRRPCYQRCRASVSPLPVSKMLEHFPPDVNRKCHRGIPLGAQAARNILSVLDGRPIRDNVINAEVLD